MSCKTNISCDGGQKIKKWKYLTTTAVLGSALFLAACGDDANNSSNNVNNEESVLSGKVNGDGSSTVAPITAALVEEYAKVQKEKDSIKLVKSLICEVIGWFLYVHK